MMKKVLIGFGIVAVVAIALGAAGLVYAQRPTPQTPGTPGSGYGRMGAGGMRGGMMGGAAAGTGAGYLHDEMIAAWAGKLNLTVDEINSRLASGETMFQIAASTGIAADQFTSLMTEVRAAAIARAVAEGQLTQAQADWMNTRMGGMMGGFGRGMRFGGQAGTGNFSCPYLDPANP